MNRRWSPLWPNLTHVSSFLVDPLVQEGRRWLGRPMNTEKTERGWRGTPDLWLDAAYQLLVEGGVEAVKVMPLAERLGLSRTSFYWHFPDREALLAGLVDRWKAKNTGNLVARCEAMMFDRPPQEQRDVRIG